MMRKPENNNLYRMTNDSLMQSFRLQVKFNEQRQEQEERKKEKKFSVQYV